MCMVSNVGDQWNETFPNKWPYLNPPPVTFPLDVSREEFNALKREVEELKKLLKAAKEYDEKTNQPDCEMEEKIKLIKQVAELVGVDLSEVFK